MGLKSTVHLFLICFVPLLPPLLALNCTSHSPLSVKINPRIRIALDKLWAEASRHGYAILQLNHFNGLMQCRLNLSPNECAQCLHTASCTILTTSITLLWQQRSSHSKISYDSSGHKLYGLAECVRSVSVTECKLCVAGAAKKLQKCCDAKRQRIFPAKSCIVQFVSYRFYSLPMLKVNASDSDVITYNSSKTENYSALKMKVVWSWWAGVSCLTGLAVGTWLLRRKIHNTAKVANVGEAIFDLGSNGDI